MRYSPALFLLALFPFCALAQSYSSAPLMVVGEGTAPAQASALAPSAKPAAPAPSPVPGAGFPNFPEAAITRIGETTTGQHVDAPASPAAPAAPANPPTAANAATPPNPASPTPPANPTSKLWPHDTIPIFMPSCTGLHVEFVQPCTCVITRLMLAMPHDEFLAKSEQGTIEQDPRLIRIRHDCATAPQKKEP